MRDGGFGKLSSGGSPVVGIGLRAMTTDINAIKKSMAKTNALFNTEIFGKRNFAAIDQIYTRDARILPPGRPTFPAGRRSRVLVPHNPVVQRKISGAHVGRCDAGWRRSGRNWKAVLTAQPGTT